VGVHVEQSIEIMVNRITSVLESNNPSLFLFGSVVLDDFRLGWSDIDFICLTEKTITNEQADELVNLRQTLLVEYPGNKYFRLFEGIMLTLQAFLNNNEDTVVYWGTSGQRITNHGGLCPFGKIELLESGRFLYGNDVRHLIPYPTRAEIIEAIKQVYEDIGKFGVEHPDGGWLLDISRCLYTLKTNQVMAKTKAGEWSIEENLCPDVSVMERVLEIRRNPLDFKNSNETKEWNKTLAPYILRFLNVLRIELDRLG
jgi:hypothetical protein